MSFFLVRDPSFFFLQSSLLVAMIPRIKRAIRKIESFRVSYAEIIANLNPAEEEHAVPSDNPIKCHRMNLLDLDQEKSKISKVDLRRHRDRYFIIDSIRLTMLGHDDWVLSPPSRCIAFYEDAFNTKV